VRERQHEEVIVVLVEGAAAEEDEEVRLAKYRRTRDPPEAEEARVLAVLGLPCHQSPLLFVQGISKDGVEEAETVEASIEDEVFVVDKSALMGS
jgi:hypothetical protein